MLHLYKLMQKHGGAYNNIWNTLRVQWNYHNIWTKNAHYLYNYRKILKLKEIKFFGKLRKLIYRTVNKFTKGMSFPFPGPYTNPENKL